MDSIPTFVRRLTSSDCRSNHLILPHALCLQYGSRIPRGVKLVVRNGYSVWLDYNLSEKRFEGMNSFYQFLNFTGGETLLVQHSGGFLFQVNIFDMYGCEKKYPNMPNFSQESAVSLANHGWSFVQHLSWGGQINDSVVVPFEYFDTLGINIPPRVYFRVSSGYEFVGSFTERSSRIEGLVNMCNMLDAPNLNGLYMVLFTFDGISRFVVRGFANSYLETPIGPSLYGFGESSEWERTAFKFVVQSCHMLDYEHGVDIPVEYRRLCKSWRKTDYITAYIGMRCWKLEIRHRSDRKRTTINNGWLTFRIDLQIEEGDLLVFEWQNETIRNFDVRIVKNHVAVRNA